MTTSDATKQTLLAILIVSRSIALIQSLLLRHIFTGLSLAVPACTWTVIDLGRGIDPYPD
jgi:hypothetical protein